MFKRIMAGKGRRATAMSAVLLLLLYIGGTSQLEILHELVHKHEVVVVHTQDDEKDPCHRLIYHHEQNACIEHDAHLTASEKCYICDLTFHGDQTLFPRVFFESTKFDQVHFSFFKSNLDSYWAVIYSSRAPPVISL